MSEYLKELRDILKPKIAGLGYQVMAVGSTLKILKGGQTIMNVSDKGEIVEMSFQGKKYTYDKWYTKPEHLANTIIRTLEVQKP
ncbi:MAG: hypothetical protein ABWW69_03490 [Pyrodictiaceae archaeon]